jgi:hypothetical protein
MKLTPATGNIQCTPNQQAQLSEVLRRIRGTEFFVLVSNSIPSHCIDGRPGAFGFAPNSAGGTESLMVADDLTTQRFAATYGTTLEAYTNTVRYLDSNLLPVGGHTDDHSGVDKSGCGANDRLPEIYAKIASQGDIVRRLPEAIGIRVDDTTHALLVDNARVRTEFSSGAEILEALTYTAGDETVDALSGDHQEVVVVVNFVPQTTLNRAALDAAFDGMFQAFNVDVWSFAIAANAIAIDSAEITSKIVALAYYNIATALVLCGPEMPVIIRR